MKKLLICCSVIFLSITIFISCKENRRKISEVNIDYIYINITNGSIHQFHNKDITIVEKEKILSIIKFINGLELSKENIVKNTGSLVGASTYRLDMNRGTKIIQRYTFYGDYVTVGKNKKRSITYKVKDNQEQEIIKYLDNLVEK
ncbi:hypothetical protein NG859_13050 [Enterococcus faecalis]|uniref:hypothetical protein n=1 Tax=Enterococcus faecalis TaxID=1351 RepID=UPI002090495C|nr:hypothetical protein [Enterococcus faecalis]MCO5422673.1 hypothetical protein [Enterococcus faecalis]